MKLEKLTTKKLEEKLVSATELEAEEIKEILTQRKKRKKATEQEPEIDFLDDEFFGDENY